MIVDDDEWQTGLDSMVWKALRSRATSVLLLARSGNETAVFFLIDGCYQRTGELPTKHPAELVSYFHSYTPSTRNSHYLVGGSRREVLLSLGDGESEKIRIILTTKHSGDDSESLTINFLPTRSVSEMSELGVPDLISAGFDRYLSSRGVVLLVSNQTRDSTDTLYALAKSILQAGQRKIAMLRWPGDITDPEIDDDFSRTVDENVPESQKEGLNQIIQDSDLVFVSQPTLATASAAIGLAMSKPVVMSITYDFVGDFLDELVSFEYERNLPIFIVFQTAVRRMCPHCQIDDVPTRGEAAEFDLLNLPVPIHVARSEGCLFCQGTSTLGRIRLYASLEKNELDLAPGSGGLRSATNLVTRKLRDTGIQQFLAGETTLAEVDNLSKEFRNSPG